MRTGRPTKLNPKVSKAICDRLRQGSTRKAAAEAGRIAYPTFLEWLKRGDEGEAPYAQFAEDVIQAEAEAEAAHAAVLQRAAEGYTGGHTSRTVKTEVRMKKTRFPDGRVVEEPVAVEIVTEHEHSEKLFDWRAAESWLKRRRRESWGDKVEQEHTGPGGGPLEIREIVVRRPASVEAEDGAPA